MICPDCGYEREEGASACRRCGAPAPLAAESRDELHVESITASGTEDNFRGQILAKEVSCPLPISKTLPIDIKKVKKGSFFRRALAFYFDFMLQGFIVFIFFIAGLSTLKRGLALSGHEMGIEDIALMTGPLLLVALTINISYFTFFHWATGQTPGKKLNNLKVVTIEGERPELLRSFVRWAGYLLSTLPFMLGFFLPLVDGQKQALHDKFAGTYVVDVGVPLK